MGRLLSPLGLLGSPLEAQVMKDLVEVGVGRRDGTHDSCDWLCELTVATSDRAAGLVYEKKPVNRYRSTPSKRLRQYSFRK